VECLCHEDSVGRSVRDWNLLSCPVNRVHVGTQRLEHPAHRLSGLDCHDPG